MNPKLKTTLLVLPVALALPSCQSIQPGSQLKSKTGGFAKLFNVAGVKEKTISAKSVTAKPTSRLAKAKPATSTQYASANYDYGSALSNASVSTTTPHQAEPTMVAETRNDDLPPMEPIRDVRTPKETPSVLVTEAADTPPQIAPTPPTIIAEASPVTAPAPIKEEGGAKDPIDIDATNGEKILLAENQDITIRGSKGVVMISGQCKTLEILGSNLEIYCDVADMVEVKGDSNKLVIGSIGAGDLTGNENSLSWEKSTQEETPEIKSSGNSNDIAKSDF